MNKYKKKIAVVLLLIMGINIISPNLARATTGPTAPEVQSFTQAGDSDLVNLFTGDFKYNIPLFELPGPNGGYPVNLSYNSGVTLEQEASWVGLGWSLNASGSVARSMRGLPDDFNGEKIQTDIVMKPKTRIGVTGGANFELFGKNLPKGKKSPFDAGVSLSIYSDNYTGIGYTIGADVGFSAALNANSGLNIGVGLTLDSDQGATLRPSAGISAVSKDRESKFNASIGAGINSREGLTNMSVSSGSGFVQHSFGSHGHTPSISIPVKNTNLSAKFKTGGALWGSFISASVTAFLTRQVVLPPDPTPAYGYLYHQNAGDDAVLDINREKEGMISALVPNLPVPIQTYDMYSVSGHGISKTFRPYRNEIGILYDKTSKSKLTSGALGVDAAPVWTKVGVNLTVKTGSSYSGKWNNSNEIAENFGFSSFLEGEKFEPWYFKSMSDMAASPVKDLDSYNGDEPITVSLSGISLNPVASKLGNQRFPKTIEERVPRSSVVTPLTNEELLGYNTSNVVTEAIPFFRVDGLNRESLPAHHIGGYMAINEEGVRYIYALPVYNDETHEYSFSASSETLENTGIDEGTLRGRDFYQKTTVPKYAYSYMLTAILGPDYIDVGDNGVDAEDNGYWVKFSYKKESDRVWKTPYKGAVYSKGLLSDEQDDRSSFSCGSKQIYYLDRAETKSHIVKFTTSDRADGVEASRSDVRGTARAKKLDQVALYARLGNNDASTIPIKTVKFNYNYELCQCEPSNVNTGAACSATAAVLGKDQGSGKLTLKSISINNGQSTRGELSPYEFTYGTNPQYKQFAQDHWGCYTNQFALEGIDRRQFPYVHQKHANEDAGAIAPNMSIGDYNAAAWSMTKIKLPEGSEIEVVYEADDYAYVQHKPAMNFVEITAADLNFSSNDVSFTFDRAIVDPEESLSASELTRRVSEAYIGNEKYLYFKAHFRIKEKGAIKDYVSGYVEINNQNNAGAYYNGVKVVGDKAFISLKKENGKHPIKIRALDQVRNSTPFLLTGQARKTQTGLSLEALNELLATIGEVRSIFKGYYDYTESRFAVTLDPSQKSYIRLRTPSKKKIGGGVRVKRIVFYENFDGDSEVVFGKTYDYTLNGSGMSSGVAAFEPSIGKEENPIRQPKFYRDKASFKSDRRFFFDYPINETYYPSPQVGYSQVTVRSLASTAREGLALSSALESYFPDIPFGTTGKQVNEFYTARDYPVFTDETNKAKTQKEFKLNAGSLLFTDYENYFTATQGYSVITNDMHGKPKATRQFRQGENGIMKDEAYSWTEYTYFDKDKGLDKVLVKQLSNDFYEDGEEPNRLRRESNGSNEVYRMGVNREIFIDMRESGSSYIEGGVQGNLDLVNIPIIFGFIPVPVPTVWPNGGMEKERVRTAVVNKCVSYNGVLKEVQTFTEGATVKNEFIAWDKLTGRSLVSRTEDMYTAGQYIYTESFPAYHQKPYKNMGGAYSNLGVTFSVTGGGLISETPNEYTAKLGPGSGNLTEGDELVMAYEDNGKTYKIRATYLGRQYGGTAALYSDTDINGKNFNAMIYRSGKRNHLNVDAGSYNYLAN